MKPLPPVAPCDGLAFLLGGVGGSLLCLSAMRHSSLLQLAGGDLVVTLQYAYEGKPPSLRKRAEMAKAVLGEALDRLEKGKPVDLGSAEDVRSRIRTDKLEA